MLIGERRGVCYCSCSVVLANCACVCICGCESRNSPCNSSDSEKKDGDNMDADNIAMAADLQEVKSITVSCLMHHLSIGCRCSLLVLIFDYVCLLPSFILL